MHRSNTAELSRIHPSF